jgi:TonB family protein
MRFPKDQPFWTSVILHLAVLLGVFLVTVVQAFKPREAPHVFQMVEAPNEAEAEADPAPNEPVPPTPPEARVPEVPLPPVPQVRLPEPSPQPAPPEPRPSPAPAPEPAPLMSAEDFFRENPKPSPRPQPVRPRPSVAVPRIEVPELVVPANPSPSRPELSARDLSALADYSARLRSRIDASWTKPAQLAGVQLSAEVIFDVSPSGRVRNVRLRQSSGNSAFDQSILAAFRRVASAGATPTGEAHQFTLTFRMRD